MPKRIEQADNRLKCSFCGKAQDQVKKLIAGPGVFICNECINLCIEILDEESITRSRSSTERLSWMLSKSEELASGPPLELSVGKVNLPHFDRPDEELQNLIDDSLKPLQALSKYCCDRGHSSGGVELMLRLILYLRTLEFGRTSEELLPLLSELSAIYSGDEEYSMAAEVIEWSVAILDHFGAPEQTKRPLMLELIKLYIKTGHAKKAELWLNRFTDLENAVGVPDNS